MTFSRPPSRCYVSAAVVDAGLGSDTDVRLKSPANARLQVFRGLNCDDSNLISQPTGMAASGPSLMGLGVIRSANWGGGVCVCVCSWLINNQQQSNAAVEFKPLASASSGLPVVSSHYRCSFLPPHGKRKRCDCPELRAHQHLQASMKYLRLEKRVVLTTSAALSWQSLHVCEKLQV